MLRKKVRDTHKIEDDLYDYLKELGDAAKDSNDAKWQQLLQKYELRESELEDMLDAHYYLSPANLVRAQLMLAIFVITMALTVTMVRVSNDWAMVTFTFAMGVVVGLPYLLLYWLMRQSTQLAQVQLLARVSLGYSLFLTAAFLVAAATMGLLGAVLIPVFITVFYIMEMVKLTKLIKRLEADEPVDKQE